jgi:DNA helicase-2/ATP-dependent DNA helicase PcrA
VTESKGAFGAAQSYGASRFDQMTAFGSNYSTPGWQRAQANKARRGFSETGAPRYGDKGVGDDSLDYVQPDYDDDTSASPRPGAKGGGRTPPRRAPLTIEGELVAKSTGAVSDFSVGDRVFHQKFGNGNVTVVDGNKLTIAFDKAGEKRVVDSFVERV